MNASKTDNVAMLGMTPFEDPRNCMANTEICSKTFAALSANITAKRAAPPVTINANLANVARVFGNAYRRIGILTRKRPANAKFAAARKAEKIDIVEYVPGFPVRTSSVTARYIYTNDTTTSVIDSIHIFLDRVKIVARTLAPASTRSVTRH